jgi:hypothetical protein
MDVPVSPKGWARAGSVLGAVAIALSLTTPASAQQSVDPAGLNPPVPAEFNPVCVRTGGHITCDVAFSDPDVVDEPSGIVCDGTELLVSQTRAVVGKRFYDGDGNLLRRHFRESLGGTFTNPVTGLVALWVQHDTVDHQLAVPGDLGTGPTKVSGLSTRTWLPGGGTILTDAGVAVFDDATGEVFHQSGHHPFSDYFSGDQSALAPLCAALD